MEVNIEKIMEEIRSEIREKGYTSNMLSFYDVTGMSSGDGKSFDPRDFGAAMNTANDICIVPFDPPLSGNPIAVFIKKLIRKLIRFYIRPTVEQQNAFNAQMLRGVNMLGSYALEDSSRINSSELISRLELTELKLATVSAENNELKERLSRLEKAISEKADEDK